MTWIESVSLEQATGYLSTLYEKHQRPNHSIANIYSAHSLRPHTLEGHTALYQAVLGHPDNVLARWFLETVGLYVSILNGCAYCIDHHTYAGRLAYPGESSGWSSIVRALMEDSIEDVFDGKRLVFLAYVRTLTLDAAGLTAKSIDMLREAGARDGEILEVNQVVGYFSYANRVALGLGVTLDGEIP